MDVAVVTYRSTSAAAACFTDDDDDSLSVLRWSRIARWML